GGRRGRPLRPAAPHRRHLPRRPPRRRGPPAERALPVTDTDLRVRTTFAVEDPATLQPIAEVADQDARDARRAVDRAASAAAAWVATTPRERSEILRKAFDLILRDRD